VPGQPNRKVCMIHSGEAARDFGHKTPFLPHGRHPDAPRFHQRGEGSGVQTGKTSG
jgi:hypothetical protein